ncbi:MAG TPA: POTRA domain-containing protein, partial [Parafilimonas sp.]|nr:POTRA domain-containing protein [Parafilimonas sp.]
LIVHPVSTDSAFINSLNLQTIFNDKTSAIQYVNQLPGLLAIKGYAAASVDSMWEDSNSVSIKLFTGENYEWQKLSINDSDRVLLSSLRYNAENFSQQNFSALKLQQLYNDVINYYSNNGYPFATIFLDSIQVKDDKISAHLNIKPGILYHIDTIIVEGNMRISKFFLQHFLQINEHDIYNESKLNTINQRLSLLTYLQQSQPWQIEMLNTGAALHLYLQPTKNNSINILVGLLPQNEETGGKLLFTGEATVGLRNSFGSGETLGLNWQQLQPRSPQLNLSYQQPYIFHFPFGVGVNFQLYKQDSQYVNINSQLALQYELTQHQSGEILFSSASTNVLNVDTNVVKQTNSLPVIADINSTSIGLQYNFYNTDYRFNPRRGNEFLITGSFGNKNIKKNNGVLQIKDPNFNAAALYDTIKLHSYQFLLQGSVSKYFPVGKQAAFKLAVNAGLFQSPNYFQNELFRIGGFKLLRGFDEASIYTNRYSVETAEYHYLLARNSWFYGFTDFGWAAYDVNNIKFNHTYLGFGVGLSLETGTGIFSISLAEGKRDDSKLNFQQSKIHLGFISLF